MVVDCAVTVVVDASGMSSEQLDYLILQSNQVENSYHEVKEHPTLVHPVAEVSGFATEALRVVELEAGKTTRTKTLSSITAASESPGAAKARLASRPLPVSSARRIVIDRS